MDLVALALAKKYTDEKVINGLDEKKVKTIIEEEIKKIIGEAGSDWDSFQELKEKIENIQLTPGPDGYSPVVELEQISDGVIVKVINKEGVTTATIYNGAQGIQGIQGEQGPKGDTGEQGDKGDKGDPGEPGVDGADYVLTDADKSEIAELAAELVEVPEAPEISMQPLTFTGAVEATYDGSEPVEVVIPQGGGGGSEDWEFINRTTLLEDASITVINSDSNGNSFKYKKLMVYVVSKNQTSQDVVMLALDADGKDLWGNGEAIGFPLGDGVSVTVTAEVIGERMVKQTGANVSATIKEQFTYAQNGHSQNAKYAYMTGYKFSGNLSAGSIIELYGKGRVSA